MRILIVSEVFAPAVSDVAVTTARLAAGLAARGHTVTVLTASQARGLPKHEARDGYQVVRAASVANPFRKGFRLTVLARRVVADTFDSVRPEIVHIQDPISLSVQAVREAARRSIPVVATHHFLPEYIFSYLPQIAVLRALARFWLRRRLNRLYARCAAVTVPTQTVRRALAASGFDAPVEVVSNGVDRERFVPGTPSDPPVILFVGRLDPEKNVSVLVEACAGLAVPYVLRVIGSGNLAGILRVQAERLGARTIWESSMDARGEGLPRAYREATVFCLPSTGETESMVTLEAMASGLPVLAANSGALPELVSSGESGLLLPAHDSAAWTAALASLLADGSCARKMGAVGRERSAARGSEATLDAIESLYGKLVA